MTMRLRGTARRHRYLSDPLRLRRPAAAGVLWSSCTFLTALAAVVLSFAPSGAVQTSKQGAIEGVVFAGQGPVAGAMVKLEPENVAGAIEANTNTAGKFVFSGLRAGKYRIVARKEGMQSREMEVVVSVKGEQKGINLHLENARLPHPGPGTRVSSSQVEFADSPDFTVAGITDWTAVGGHGSDSILRTSEALARDTRALEPEGQEAGVPSDKGSAKVSKAKAHRLAAELDEKQGRPLAAVHEFEQAARLDPSEQNYFEWGSELLYHRAVWQALEIFQRGATAYPESGRMLTALGTALFMGARYEKAALSLCRASDLNPDDVQPYIFMGKVELASPDLLPCVEAKLARFLREQPENSEANYLYAMAILKRHQPSTDPKAVSQAEALLENAVRLDSACGQAYLQLGNLSYSRGDIVKAVDFYRKAIEANPQLGESYYRLGVAYDRLGDVKKARQELQLHDEIEKQQAEAVEDQRRRIKQFVIVGEPSTPQAR